MANESKTAGKIATYLAGVVIVAVAGATINGAINSASAEVRVDAIEAKVDVNTRDIEAIGSLIVKTNAGVEKLAREVVVLQTLVEQHTEAHQR